MAEVVFSVWKNYTEKPRRDMFQLHLHEHYELFCFLSGSAAYYVEGTVYPLSPGDIVLLKKAESHSLLIDKSIPYERIVLGFNGEALLEELQVPLLDFLDNRPLGQKNYYSFTKTEGEKIRFFLDRILGSQDLADKRLYLTVLLNELRAMVPTQPKAKQTESVGEWITYVNEHLFEEISPSLVAENFFVSKGHLNRKFKAYVGCTVWEYISTKRLIRARELLQTGVHPTVVSEKCGFENYSTFYRAYLQKYQNSPKQDYQKLA